MLPPCLVSVMEDIPLRVRGSYLGEMKFNENMISTASKSDKN